MDTDISSPVVVADTRAATMTKRAHYSPPWADLSIIGIAGSSGSGKSTLSHAIVSKLNLPWVVILSMVGIRVFQGGNDGWLCSHVAGLLLQTFRCRIIQKGLQQ